MIYKYGWKAIGFNSYKEYLLNDIWLYKQRTMLEGSPLCEKCGKKKATQVHHLH